MRHLELYKESWLVARAGKNTWVWVRDGFAFDIFKTRKRLSTAHVAKAVLSLAD